MKIYIKYAYFYTSEDQRKLGSSLSLFLFLLLSAEMIEGRSGEQVLRRRRRKEGALADARFVPPRVDIVRELNRAPRCHGMERLQVKRN
jgi:hypothetical protein